MFFPNLTSSEWASWVQALGSILAIFASFLLINYQHNKSKKLMTEQKNEEQRELIKNIIKLGDNSTSLIIGLMQRIRTPPETSDLDTGLFYAIATKGDLNALKLNNEAILGMPIHELPYEYMYRSLNITIHTDSFLDTYEMGEGNNMLINKPEYNVFLIGLENKVAAINWNIKVMNNSLITHFPK